MNGKVLFDPTSDKWALSDGKHYLEVPHWAREIIADEFERETKQLKADNACLRDERDGWKKLCVDQLVTYIMNEEMLENENAKLRELAAGIGHLLFALDVDYCAGCPRDDINHPCPVYTVKGGECLYETDLRDLGVEVDG